MRPEFACQRLLVLAAGDGDGAEPHLRRELHAEMAEPADPEHRDDIGRTCAAFPQRVERGDAGTQQRRGLGRRQPVRDQGQGVRRCDHRLGIAAVVIDARDLQVATVDDVAAATRLAVAAMPAKPADADAGAHAPAHHVGADRVDDAGHFVPRHQRVLHPGKQPILGDHVAVADAASLDLDANLAALRLRQLALDQFQRAALMGHLHDAHLRHHALPVVRSDAMLVCRSRPATISARLFRALSAAGQAAARLLGPRGWPSPRSATI